MKFKEMLAATGAVLTLNAACRTEFNEVPNIPQEAKNEIDVLANKFATECELLVAQERGEGDEEDIPYLELERNYRLIERIRRINKANSENLRAIVTERNSILGKYGYEIGWNSEWICDISHLEGPSIETKVTRK